MKQLVHFIWLILLSQQAFSQTITWTGATDTDWATGTNWSTNVAPTNANKVNIPGSLARYPVLNGSNSGGKSELVPILSSKWAALPK